MNLTPLVLWKIWKYAGPKALFLDKTLLKIIKNKREQFIKKPLRIYYNLIRWKQKRFYVRDQNLSASRPSMCLEEDKYIDIREKQYLGKVFNDNTIILSKKITTEIIPKAMSSEYLGEYFISNEHFEERMGEFSMHKIYWTINSVWTKDNRAQLYSFVWPNKNLN